MMNQFREKIRKWRKHPIRTVLLTFFLVFCTISLIYMHNLLGRNEINSQWLISHEYFKYDIENETIDPSQTCPIPNIHPFDSSILKFVFKVPPLKCSNVQLSLTYINGSGYLQFNVETLEKYALVATFMNCQYREVLQHYANKDDTFKYSASKPLKGPVNVLHADFIHVSCKNLLGFTFYRDIHTHIRDLPSKNQKDINATDKYNVLMFGMDSVSRLNMMRQLPNTFKFLKDELRSFVMRGYHKVGSNTFPNLATMLTGAHPFKKPYVYFPIDDERKPMDNWPFIWKNYSKEGYRTFFSEDQPHYNAFHYMRGGFINQPTDHYARPFWKAAYFLDGNSYTNEYCFMNHLNYKIHIDYLEKFVIKMADETPYWAFSFLTQISHSKVNLIGVADEDILNFIKNIHDRHLLENTVLIFFADHGQRFDYIRQTNVGGIEDKMPLFSIYFPERFRKSEVQALKNLKVNEMRLTSAFDVYCTLIDILKLSKDPNHILGNYKILHGISLFGEIPKNRNCSVAGIDAEFCACDLLTVVDKAEPYVLAGAQIMVDKINSIIIEKYKTYKLCSKLLLKNVVNSHYFGTPRELATAVEKRIRLNFEVSPSGGIYEGIFEVSGQTNLSYSVVGSIERINRYGNQPYCISDSEMRIFCYCH